MRLLLVLGLLTACSPPARFETVATSDGRLYRLDRWFGGMALVNDSQLVAVRPFATAQARFRADNPFAIEAPKTWPIDSIPQIGARAVTLVSRCRNGYFDYKLTVEPVPQRYPGSTGEPFALHLLDGAGFTLTSQALGVTSFSRRVDDAGKPVALLTEGRLPLALEDCLFVASWNVSWRF